MISLNTNSMAHNAADNLITHYGRLSSSVSRLSSGLRINSAADDAAGLAIAELMRSNTAALHQGMRNVNDAISLLQVADGALSIIDEKLIRMKELAEQAATGTYNSTQRLLIHSEFQAMGSEIDRISNATDFNGIKLLDGSCDGTHNGSNLDATGAIKIHFGSQNDSAEDYYYINIGACGTAGLGLRDGPVSGAPESAPANVTGELKYEDVIAYPPYSKLNDYTGNYSSVQHGQSPFDVTTLQQDKWYCGVSNGTGSQNTMLLIKAGTKNFVLNEIGSTYGTSADNDIQLFSTTGKHLAGRSPIPDYDNVAGSDKTQPTNLGAVCNEMGFTLDQYDNSFLNSGARDQNDGAIMNFTSYNGMTIGYSGDGPETYDNISRFEVLYIDEAKEDLIVWMPGVLGAVFKYYLGEGGVTEAPATPPTSIQSGETELIKIDTQEKAQQALERIDSAIVKKDEVRAHLGSLQNRFENTVANLSMQYEALQSAESRITDADIAREMTEFVKNQVLSQSACAVLAQANSLPSMLISLLNS